MKADLLLHYKDFLEERAQRLRWACGFARPPYDPAIVAAHCCVAVEERDLDQGLDGYIENNNGIWTAHIARSSPATRRRLGMPGRS